MLNQVSASDKKIQIFVWTLFDLANTAFYVIILTVGYPLYFKEIINNGNRNGDFLWGLAFSISMLIVAIISPFLGAIADYTSNKKKFLLILTLLCIFATSILFYTGPGTILLGMILLILANIGFEGGLVFYDAFLPEITTERSYGRVSGYGFAMGYIGSLITLLIVLPLYSKGFVADNLQNIRITFLIAASFFLIFALPLFLFLKEKKGNIHLNFNLMKIGYQRVTTTFKQFNKYKNIGKFLLSYFLYIDAINTIIIFSSIFARESLNFELTEIIILFSIVQSSAIIGSILFGVLSDHAGQKKTLTITLILWLLIIMLSYFVQSKDFFYLIGGLAGLALGSSQSTSRSLMSKITPEDKKTEFFGFYSFFGKASAIIGPLIFGFVSSAISQRTAILTIGLIILAGLFLLQRVEEKRF
ncbi:MAG: MFS transporter family protein [Ignavibacteriae bacterium]|nr:MAG: MFS transporter family protein [Ignavibacteriota bacterium]